MRWSAAASAVAFVLSAIACGRQPVAPTAASEPVVDSTTAAQPQQPSTPPPLSGNYRMTIDATGASCGPLFAEPFTVDGNLHDNGDTLLFEHTRSRYQNFSMMLNLAGRAVGSISFADHEVPTSGQRVFEALDSTKYGVTVASINDDGTIGGTFGGTVSALDSNAVQLGWTRCSGTFSWTLAPAGDDFHPF